MSSFFLLGRMRPGCWEGALVAMREERVDVKARFVEEEISLELIFDLRKL